jgi:hypothetical protein
VSNSSIMTRSYANSKNHFWDRHEINPYRICTVNNIKKLTIEWNHSEKIILEKISHFQVHLDERGQVDSQLMVRSSHYRNSLSFIACHHRLALKNVFKQLLCVSAQYDNFDTNKTDQNVLSKSFLSWNWI